MLRLSAVPAQASQEAAALLRRAAAEASSAPVAASAAEAAAHSAVTGAGFSMADGRQTLRVHLCAPLPCALRCGCWHTIAVRLTNEMGLFDAEAFAAAASGRVRLDAVALSSEAGPLRLTLRQAADPAPPPDAAPASLPTHPGDGASGGVLLQLHRGRATAEVRLELREERESSSGCCSCARRGQHAAGRPQPEHAAEQCAAALAVLRATVEATVGDGARAGSAPACGSAGAGAGVGRRGAADATLRRAAPPPAMPPLGALSLPLPLLGRSAGGGAEGGSAGGGSVGGGGDAADEPAADIALRDALRPTPATHPPHSPAEAWNHPPTPTLHPPHGPGHGVARARVRASSVTRPGTRPAGRACAETGLPSTRACRASGCCRRLAVRRARSLSCSPSLRAACSGRECGPRSPEITRDRPR